ncbi:DHA2 family efflux MFS transporter permease subunit [Dictyobacter kobayashii]|uniref:MFS transporter n=1 Tax=Dictyobacter kobayashii TaxID=2014872 RepID=A0A402AHK7_9CHLR|nr:DHA2 family efflux MFS transporter permease subunit [Dictyobacter kobayashii]GCE18600.1 MFS transporter [Dictyobacter kobayashii]
MKQQENSAQSHVNKENQASENPVNQASTGGAVQSQNGKWTTLLVVAIGVFMATLDSSIVNISLPAIAKSFGVPLSGAIEWVVIAYLVVTAAILLTAGRLADMLGRKIVWLTGLIFFTGSSALCGLAPTLAFLIAARALQGLGGALLLAVSPAMLTSAFPSHERGRALGLNAITVSLGVSVGPILGGLITGYFTWRWIFFVNLPFGILGLIATLVFIKEKTKRNPGRFDPLGATLLAIGLACVTAGLSFAQELGWGSVPILVLLIVGALALIILPFVELRVPNPAIVLSLLKNRVFTSALLSLIISFLALFAVSFMLPFYLEELRGFSSELSGFLLTPLPLMIAFIAPISGSLADRIGTRWLAAGGLTIAGLGLVFISFLNEHTPIWGIVWPLVITGIGQSIFQSPNNSALLGRPLLNIKAVLRVSWLLPAPWVKA